MSARVSLSRRDAQALLELCEERHPGWLAGQQAAIDRLRAALSPRPKKPMRVERERDEQAERERHRAETARIREACFERSGGLCEACTASGCDMNCAMPVTWESGELDHWFGKGKVKQAVSNCWFICPTCHVGKTKSRNEEFWLMTWISHCRKYSYLRELRMAEAKLESLALSRASAEAGKGGRHV